MTSVFKQAANQTCSQFFKQQHQSIEYQPSKISKLESEPKSGKNKYASKHSFKIMINYEKDIASMISSNQPLLQLQDSSTSTLPQNKSKLSKIGIDQNLEILSNTQISFKVSTNSLEILNLLKQPYQISNKMLELEMIILSCNKSLTTYDGL